ncbi:MAG: hypothetical protein A3K19_32345 [Lentisphaerae bacterium RIFOXYB12_FULL_65_16]|nr:MAG: hypothetical protein A3K18_13135 [Lentisphaerae bacterium RIFOXYA12_64_32]OGV85710.1 MAG: hypothetical protein A3K19_32345 [Lentisphaerae bacterium RIFOXYB12_FULL_65_16]
MTTLPDIRVYLTAALCGLIAVVAAARLGADEVCLTQELGEVSALAPFHCAVPLKNDSAEPFKVNRVRTSCPCVYVLEYPAELGPREAGTVHLAVFPQKEGDFNLKVWFETSAAATPLLAILLHGIVTGTPPPGLTRFLSVLDPPLLTTPVCKQPTDDLTGAAQAMQDHAPASRFVVVDVRPEAEFSAACIPGSVNRPAYALSASPLPKDRDVLLVDSGWPNPRLIRECRKLRDTHLAASATILAGGLNAWERAGGRLQGSAVMPANLRRIPPANFYTARRFDGWQVLDISGTAEPLPAFLFPGRQTVKTTDVAESLRALAEAARQTPRGLTWVLVVDERGESGDLPARIEAPAGTVVFFLDGGWRAFEKYLQEQTAMHHKGTVRTTQPQQPCEGCK